VVEPELGGLRAQGWRGGCASKSVIPVHHGTTEVELSVGWFEVNFRGSPPRLCAPLPHASCSRLRIADAILFLSWCFGAGTGTLDAAGGGQVVGADAYLPLNQAYELTASAPQVADLSPSWRPT